MAAAMPELAHDLSAIGNTNLRLLERGRDDSSRSLPSPEQLAEYEKLAPGASEQIIRAHIESLSAPTEMSWRLLDEDTRKFRITVILFSLVPITLGMLAFFLATMEKDGPSIAAFIAAAVAMVAVTFTVFKLFKPPAEVA